MQNRSSITDATSPPRAIQAIFVLGSPGGGKGTLCKRLSAEFGCYHLSVGDCLRELIKEPATLPSDAFGGTSLFELQDKLKKQELLPAEVIAGIVAHKITVEAKAGRKCFLIDGYPRQVESAQMFEEKFNKPAAVLLFECPKEVAKARFVERKRETDNAELFDRRYAEYQVNNQLIVDRYPDILQTIDTSGDQDATYAALKTAVRGFLGSEMQ